MTKLTTTYNELKGLMKWRSLQSKIRHVYLVEEDIVGGEPRQFFVHAVNGDPVHLTSNTFADTWEEVIE